MTLRTSTKLFEDSIKANNMKAVVKDELINSSSLILNRTQQHNIKKIKHQNYAQQ